MEMGVATVLALAGIGWRLNGYNAEAVTPIGIAILSVVIAVLVSAVRLSVARWSTPTAST
jgi:hypothetical protein